MKASKAAAVSLSLCVGVIQPSRSLRSCFLTLVADLAQQITPARDVLRPLDAFGRLAVNYPEHSLTLLGDGDNGLDCVGGRA